MKDISFYFIFQRVNCFSIIVSLLPRPKCECCLPSVYANMFIWSINETWWAKIYSKIDQHLERHFKYNAAGLSMQSKISPFSNSMNSANQGCNFVQLWNPYTLIIFYIVLFQNFFQWASRIKVRYSIRRRIPTKYLCILVPAHYSHLICNNFLQSGPDYTLFRC